MFFFLLEIHIYFTMLLFSMHGISDRHREVSQGMKLRESEVYVELRVCLKTFGLTQSIELSSYF